MIFNILMHELSQPKVIHIGAMYSYVSAAQTVVIGRYCYSQNAIAYIPPKVDIQNNIVDLSSDNTETS